MYLEVVLLTLEKLITNDPFKKLMNEKFDLLADQNPFINIIRQKIQSKQ